MTAPHVAALRLAQFRSHRRTEIAVPPGPVALYGPNGAGKTNVLEAVSMLSPGRGLRRAAPDQLARAGVGAGWKVTADVATPGGLRPVATQATDGPRQVRIDDKAAPQTALARLVRLIWLVPAMDRLWTEAPEGRRRFLDRMAMSFVPDHAEAATAYDKAMRERNRLLRDGVGDARWYDALERQMALTGAALTANRAAAVAALNDAQADAATAFPAVDLALAGPEQPPGAEALATALAEGRRDDMAAGRTLAGPHRADLAGRYAAKDLDAALCSTGEQKALLISTVLANARALAAREGEVPVLLLDEVAAHLDAGRRADLFAEIEGLGAQAWMTGTGPELFDALGPGAARFEITATAEGSHLRRD